jgi:hypothetical protein
MGVGTAYPFSSIAFKIGSVIFNSLNVIIVIFAVSKQLLIYIVKGLTNSIMGMKIP